MEKNTFDNYAEEYRDTVNSSISFSGLKLDFFTEVKVYYLKHLLNTFFPKSMGLIPQILDIGCGVGETDSMLTADYPFVTGVDVSEESISRAKKRNPNSHYLHYDGKKLPFPDNHFEVAFTINVMHHVPPVQWPSFIAEALRVVKPGGIFTIFEHNPYNPLTLKAVKDCPFDHDAVLLKKRTTLELLKSHNLQKMSSQYILFFPFRSPLFRSIEQIIGFIPLGAQYFVCVQKR